MSEREPVSQEIKDRYDRLHALSLEEALDYISELGERFEDVKRHYTGPIGKYRRKLREEDDRILSDCVGELLPLSTNPALQAQSMDVLRRGNPDGESPTIYETT